MTHERLAKINDWCQVNDIDGLYFLAAADDPATVFLAEKSGFHLVDIRVTFSYDVSIHSGAQYSDGDSGELRFRPSRLEDIPRLQEIARVSYRDSRFFYDPYLKSKQAEALFAEWIERSCHEYADIVFTAELGKRPVGYISCDLDTKSNKGSIGLVGVHPNTRGMGIGRQLVMRALQWFARNRATRATVITQGRNIAAQRLYQRCGFLTGGVQLWYHKWFVDCETQDNG